LTGGKRDKAGMSKAKAIDQEMKTALKETRRAMKNFAPWNWRFG